MIKNTSCAVYIATCDRYSDLWPGFFHCWNRYWPDCPFEVYLGANEKSWPGADVTTLSSPPDSAWSEQVARQLETLSYEYVLCILDDFYLRARVCTSRIMDLLQYLKAADGAMLRLLPRPPPQIRSRSSPSVGECLPNTPYRICTQAAIWRRRDLISLLQDKESIWEFEANGQARADATGKRFFSVYNAAFPYQGMIFHHVVEKGEWIPSEYWWCRRRGIPCERSKRKLLSFKDFSILLLAEFLNWFLTIIAGGHAHSLRVRIKAVIPQIALRTYQRMRKYSPVKRPTLPDSH